MRPRSVLAGPALAAAAAAAVVALGAAGTPARADGHCPPPGGAADRLPPHEPAGADADWVIEGRGWGHGAGMSQYGAFGAAQAGCAAATILETYFPGTAVGPLPVAEPDEVRVSLLHPETGEPTWEAADVATRAIADGDITWHTPDGATHVQPAGETWTVEPVGDGTGGIGDPLDGGEADGPWRLTDDSGTAVWSGGEPGQRLSANLDGAPAVELAQKDGRAYGEGTLRFEIANDEAAYPSVAIGHGPRPALDRYLHGLREVPRTWPGAALRAQVITGRGYAADRIAGNPAGGRGCPDCHLVDSPADQVYAGLSVREDAGGQRWLDAVGATTGQVVRYRGDIARTFYSSSHGGQGESGAFSAALGVDRPYLQPVDDSRWELAADGANPHLRWTRTATDPDVRDAVEAATGTDVGEIQAVRTPEPTGAGGRVGSPAQGFGGVEVTGSRATETLSGWQFVSGLELRTASDSPGLRSELYEVFPGGLTRLAGAGRVDSAAVAAMDGWGDTGADTAVLATAWDYADALAATALAAGRDAPVLLTPGDALAAQAAATLDALGVDTVVVMGGEAAIAPAVTDELAARGHDVVRVEGPTRFDTAADAARASAVDAPLVGLPGDPSDELAGATVDEVALARGTDWPDALSAGALGASGDRVPTLLTLRDELHPAARAALADLDPETVHLIGGTGVLSQAVADELKAEGYAVNRFAGSTRFATSALVARDALARDDRDTAVLASGQTFPDALAAGAYSARSEGVLALVARDRLDLAPPVRDLLAEGAFSSGTILGGPAAVSDDVRRDAARHMTR